MTSETPRRETIADAAAPASPDTDAPEPAEPEAELPPAPGPSRRRKRLILVGAGHAHLQILDWWRERPIRGVELTLVSAFAHAVYSGMLPSVLAGLISEKEMRIDLARLTRRCGAQLVIDKVIGLDPETRTLDLAVHPEESFDVASLNIGSTNLRDDLCQTRRVIVAVKPLATFLSRLELRLQELLQQYRDAPGAEYLQLAVVGGGAAGVELAMCLEERSHRERWHAEVRLFDSAKEILPGFAARSVRLVRGQFRRRKISLHQGSAVVDCEDDGPAELVLESGARIRVDLVIWAAGAAPPGLLRGYQLPKTDRGYVAVRQTLQTTADLPVFAAGDVADIVTAPCPKSGVYAVRQAPILWENLQRWFRGRELARYEPQRRFLSLLSCGDRTAILNYRGLGLRSSWMWTLKQHIDRKFVERFQ